MKKLNAQIITEFMIAVPVLIIFFIILTEFATAFNAHVVLNNATTSSFHRIISNINIENTKSTYKASVQNYIANDIRNNKLPNQSSLKTELITVNNYPAVISTYTYTPSLTYGFLPALNNINISSVAIFPFELPNNTKYKEGLSSKAVEARIAPLPPPPPPPPPKKDDEKDNEEEKEEDTTEG